MLFDIEIMMSLSDDKQADIIDAFKKIGIRGRVWYLIVSIPDLCPHSHFKILHAQMS